MNINFTYFYLTIIAFPISYLAFSLTSVGIFGHLLFALQFTFTRGVRYIWRLQIIFPITCHFDGLRTTSLHVIRNNLSNLQKMAAKSREFYPKVKTVSWTFGKSTFLKLASVVSLT